MNELLRFLLDHCAFLYKDYGFRIVDSMYWPQSFGNAHIDLKWEDFRVRLDRDRARISLRLFAGRDEYGYDMGILHTFLKKEGLIVCLTEVESASFLQQNFPALAALFSPERMEETATALGKLKNERAKAMFPGYPGGE